MDLALCRGQVLLCLSLVIECADLDQPAAMAVNRRSGVRRRGLRLRRRYVRFDRCGLDLRWLHRRGLRLGGPRLHRLNLHRRCGHGFHWRRLAGRSERH